MHRIETPPRITYRMMEVPEMREVTLALPTAAQSTHDLAQVQEPGRFDQFI